MRDLLPSYIVETKKSTFSRAVLTTLSLAIKEFEIDQLMVVTSSGGSSV